MIEIIGIVFGSITTITISSLLFSKWVIAREDRLDKEEEERENPKPERCPRLSNHRPRERCDLDFDHFGPHKHTFGDGEIAWWN